ncbi:hypothetical protein Hanom_Chr03g00188081 [Helianthus anomalus]
MCQAEEALSALYHPEVNCNQTSRNLLYAAGRELSQRRMVEEHGHHQTKVISGSSASD